MLRPPGRLCPLRLKGLAGNTKPCRSVSLTKLNSSVRSEGIIHVVFEMPCPDNRLLFVASDVEDKTQADDEIVQWATVHGYQVPQSDQVYMIFQNRRLMNDWRLVERCAA